MYNSATTSLITQMWMSVQMMMDHHVETEGAWTLMAVLYAYAILDSSNLIILMSVKVNAHILAGNLSHLLAICIIASQSLPPHTYILIQTQMSMSVLRAVKRFVPMGSA